MLLGKHITFNFSQIIACAVQFDDQHVGVYAGDGDCYVDFKDVLEPVICEYHNVGEDFKHVSDLDPDKITGNINPNAPIHSTRQTRVRTNRLQTFFKIVVLKNSLFYRTTLMAASAEASQDPL